MSPEAMQFGIYSDASDVWSYGIVLFEIITFGVFPYNNVDDWVLVERIKRTECTILDFLPEAARGTVV